jgi:uncharacterized protein
MAVFELKNSKAVGDLPSQCRDVIKRYKDDGMFNIDSITNGKQEYTTVYFLMTQDCNLRCAYCYQPKEFRQKNTGITQDVIDATMDWVSRTFDERKIKFSIFGGEPFLNFPMLKYLCETYCMYRYVVTTNGLILLEDQDVRDWVLKHKYHLNLSVSISALRSRFGKSYLNKVKPLLDLVISNGGDVHYVVDDPEREFVYEEIVWLYEYGVPIVRVSSARHWDMVKNKNEAFKDLFRRIADYVYFTGQPKFGRSQWDIAFKNNIYRKMKGIALKDVPPTFCGCGYLYLAVNNKGEIYPCDFFANYPEFKIGDVWDGFNDTAFFFKKMGDWIDDLYEHCRDCEVCFDGDIRCCPRAMCLAENYTVTGNPLKPAPNHCWANRIETATYEYIAKKAIETGIDALYHKGRA